MTTGELRHSWDEQQAWHLPDREERLGFLVALAASRRQPDGRLRVLDLACGTGSITERLLRRCPDAQVVAVDVDPVLLRLARAAFGGDARVRVVEADLRDPAWARVADISERPFDAIVTATALHWLPEADVARVYRDLAAVVRPEGIFANADHMPPDTARLTALLRTIAEDERAAYRAAHPAAVDWDTWWQRLAERADFAESLAERQRVFADRARDTTGTHPPEFTPGIEWHLSALRQAGFAEAAEVWRRGRDAIVAALR